MSNLNLSIPLRNAVLGMSSITDLLGTWSNEPSVHTRRPLPDDATYPCVAISPAVFITNQDALDTFRPVGMWDLATYAEATRMVGGRMVDGYRELEEIAYALFEGFHRQKHVLLVESYSIIDIVASGPTLAPSGNDRLLGRVVPLTIRLKKNS